MQRPLATVFGGSGFIGRYIVRALAAEGWRVRVAVRRPHTAYFLRALGEVGQVEPFQANIRDPKSIERAVAGATAVINLVGVLYESGSQTFANLQAEGAGRVAGTAAKAGASHFIQMSAIGADADSESAYASSKAEGENAVKAAFPAATILRPSIVFGPEDDFFNRFATLARFSPVLPLISGGLTKFQPVYVGDVAKAVVAALKSPVAAGRTFELGGPTIYSFKGLMELMMSVTGGHSILVPVPRPLALLKAYFLQLLPKPLLTVDQVRLLDHDNVVNQAAADLAALDIIATPAEAILPLYLARFRKHGEFEAKGA